MNEKAILLASTGDLDSLLSMLEEFKNKAGKYPERNLFLVEILAAAVQSKHQQIVETMFQMGLAVGNSMLATAIILDDRELFELLGGKRYVTRLKRKRDFCFLRLGIQGALKHNRVGIAKELMGEGVPFSVREIVTNAGIDYLRKVPKKIEQFFASSMSVIADTISELIEAGKNHVLLYLSSFLAVYPKIEERGKIFTIMLQKVLLSGNSALWERLTKDSFPATNWELIQPLYNFMRKDDTELLEKYLQFLTGVVDDYTLNEKVDLRRLQSVETARVFLKYELDAEKVLSAVLEIKGVKSEEVIALFGKRLDIDTILKIVLLGRSRNKELVQKLFQIGADAQSVAYNIIKGKYKYFHILYALRLLLEAGANWYKTMLYALNNEQDDIVSFLLENRSGYILSEEEKNELKSILSTMESEYQELFTELLE